jgi:16S rRNA (uracil1498-N3)-methyltransferase
VHRFFLPPETLRADEVALPPDVAHQIARVLRLRRGDRILLLDDSGWQAEAELVEVSPQAARAHILTRTLATTEPRLQVVLYQAVLKGERFELILQKGTELGVGAFVPLLAARCVAGHVAEANHPKQQRWQRIIREAAEQSGRGRLPRLLPAMLFEHAVARATAPAFIPWESVERPAFRAQLRRALRQMPHTVSLFIGPEGGFTPEEIALAQRHGVQPVTLGPRVMRAETAAIITAAMALYEAGDLDRR